MSESTYRHFYGKALDAARGGYDVWRAQSTGERVSVALALNRADWLEKIGYTIAEAIDRAGPEWVELVPRIERELREQGELIADDNPA